MLNFATRKKISQGKVLEWLKRHAWKACNRRNRFVGSNPILSAEREWKPAKSGFLFLYPSFSRNFKSILLWNSGFMSIFAFEKKEHPIAFRELRLHFLGPLFTLKFHNQHEKILCFPLRHDDGYSHVGPAASIHRCLRHIR